MHESNTFINLLRSLIILLFISLVYAQAEKKFVLDEIDFPAVALATSEKGVPVYYRGEENQNHIGIYHPPIYIYSLAGFIKLFGYSEINVRSFGMICTLMTAFLALLIFEILFPKSINRHRFSLLFLSIFLLHPYTIANTTLPDIDQTILPVTMLLFIYFFLKYFPERPSFKKSNTEEKIQIKPVLVLSLILALNFWAKMTTPLAMLPSAFCILLVSKYKLRDAFLTLVAITIISTIMFVFTYWIYCKLAVLPFDYTFQFLSHSFSKGTSSSGGLSNLLKKIIANASHIQFFTNWITIVFLFAFFLSFGNLLSMKIKSHSEKILIILAGLALFVSVFYLSLIAPFGNFFKYPYPVFSLFVLTISYFLSIHVFSIIKTDNLSKKWPASSLSIVFILVFAFVSLMQLVKAKDIAILTNHSNSSLFLIGIVIVGIVTGALFNKFKSFKILSYIATSLLATLLGVQIGISRSQAVAPYPTKYEYGKIGFEETIAYLKGRVEPDEVIWSMKDVGYYVNNRYIENYGYIFNPDLKNILITTIQEKKVRFFIVTTGIGQDRVDEYSTLKESLDFCCDVERVIGNFVIYKARLK